MKELLILGTSWGERARSSALQAAGRGEGRHPPVTDPAPPRSVDTGGEQVASVLSLRSHSAHLESGAPATHAVTVSTTLASPPQAAPGPQRPPVHTFLPAGSPPALPFSPHPQSARGRQQPAPHASLSSHGLARPSPRPRAPLGTADSCQRRAEK